MTDEFLAELHSAVHSLKNCIIKSVVLNSSLRRVTVNLITDCAFTPIDKANALSVVKKYVPSYFESNVEISKLSPDEAMVKNKIFDAVCAVSKTVFATLSIDNITVKKMDNGFYYTVAVAPAFKNLDLSLKITAYLKKCFCGEFEGECICSDGNLENLTVEEKEEDIEFELPIRKFKIEDFEFLEGDKIQDTAVYLADLNFAAVDVVICGQIDDIKERSYTNKKGIEKKYFSIVLNDTTASVYATYFMRQKSEEKIKQLKVGDSIVCTGSNEEFKGDLRYTAKTIDFGKIPAGFVPEKRPSKPVPVSYKFVKPQMFVDTEQTNLFIERTVPECLKGKSFVVLDLETTGLNSTPVSGNMDKIIEIGAYKIEDGEITQSFTTFINPEKKLSDEITKLTGITEDMVANAPTYADAMPDFYKFCYGSILVGHNLVGFDYKFIDYYWSKLGYIFDRRAMDTIPLAQELLFLSNYKLNTVADKFNITFNHHRAIDDALATAKVFLELIAMKKSLPKLQ